MSTQKPRHQERVGGITLAVNQFEASEERDLGFDPSELDLPIDGPITFNPASPEWAAWHRAEVSRLAAETSYIRTPEIRSPENNFNVTGELINNWRQKGGLITESPTVTQPKIEDKPVSKERKTPNTNSESFFDFLKGNIDFGLLFKATKGLFNLGVDTVKTLNNTAKEAATVNPENKTVKEQEDDQKKAKQKAANETWARQFRTASPDERTARDLDERASGLAEALKINTSATYIVSQRGEVSTYHLTEQERSLSLAARLQEERKKQIQKGEMGRKGFNSQQQDAAEKSDGHYTKLPG